MLGLMPTKRTRTGGLTRSLRGIRVYGVYGTEFTGGTVTEAREVTEFCTAEERSERKRSRTAGSVRRRTLEIGVRIDPTLHAVHQFRDVEVDQQAHGTVGQAQISEKLRFVNRC